jgi:hypothetical protein
LTPGERALGTRWLGGWPNPRTGLDYMESNITKFEYLLYTEIHIEILIVVADVVKEVDIPQKIF